MSRTMADLIERLRKAASLGNNIYNPWPQKELNEAADRIASLEKALAAKEWRGTESAPTREIVNVVGRYKHATAGYPRYAALNEETGEWLEYSKHEPEPLVVWAWRPRDGWPDERARFLSQEPNHER